MGEYAAGTSSPAEAIYSFDDAIALAVRLHQSGQMQQAEILYRSILSVEPEHPVATHFLGLLQHQAGNHETALALILQSLDMRPDEAGWQCNLANTFVSLQREAEAESAFKTAISLDPQQFQPYSGLQKLYEAQGRIGECVLLQAAFTVATPQQHKPGTLGRAYSRLGRQSESEAQFRLWVESEPDNPVAHHMWLASAGGEMPERASDEYVQRTFDIAAADFNQHIGQLDYKAPQLILDIVSRLYGAPGADLTILDAGCGTGLCGILVAPYAKYLAGVDLSGNMLVEASKCGCYDELERAELADFLERQQQAYDVILSADTLCYFGALERVVRAAFAALREGGRFVFTVESANADGIQAFRLLPNGRYQHQAAYIAAVGQKAGFTHTESINVELRLEAGSPVQGLLVVFGLHGEISKTC